MDVSTPKRKSSCLKRKLPISWNLPPLSKTRKCHESVAEVPSLINSALADITYFKMELEKLQRILSEPGLAENQTVDMPVNGFFGTEGKMVDDLNISPTESEIWKKDIKKILTSFFSNFEMPFDENCLDHPEYLDTCFSAVLNGVGQELQDAKHTIEEKDAKILDLEQKSKKLEQEMAARDRPNMPLLVTPRRDHHVADPGSAQRAAELLRRNNLQPLHMRSAYFTDLDLPPTLTEDFIKSITPRSGRAGHHQN